MQGEKSIAMISFAVYILTGYGLFRSVAVFSDQVQIFGSSYLMAVGIVLLAGLLLIYLPLRLLAGRGGERYAFLCRADRMSRMDYISSILVLIFLAAYRFWKIPVSFVTEQMPVLRINLLFQAIGLYFLFRGFRTGVNRLAAWGAALAVIFMPSFSTSVYTDEMQSMLMAVVGVISAVCMKDSAKNLFRASLFAVLVLLLGVFQTDALRYQILHSLTPGENTVVMIFFLVSAMPMLSSRDNPYHGSWELGVPFGVLFLIYLFMGVPVCEQGIFHVLLGALAGASVAHILTAGQDIPQKERSREMNSGKRTVQVEEAVSGMEKRKLAPGEYLENPLPVPKKHVRKEMDYGFEPGSDKMCYDISISEEDDFDLP